MFKVWITKYALTQGIIEEEVEKCDSNMIVVEKKYPEFYHGQGREWHLDKESAIKKAEQMRQKKINSLKRRIDKLEKMKFD